MSDPNISVELTDRNELHCFKLIFRAKATPAFDRTAGLPEDERVSLEINMHTRQAFDLFHQLGEKLMDYFAQHSLELLQKLGERDEARRLLEMATHSLRSYQYGNSAIEAAKESANAIERFLQTGEPQTIVGKERGKP